MVIDMCVACGHREDSHFLNYGGCLGTLTELDGTVTDCGCGKYDKGDGQ